MPETRDGGRINEKDANSNYRNDCGHQTSSFESRDLEASI